MKKTCKIVGLDLSISGTGLVSSSGEAITISGNAKLGDSRLLRIIEVVSEHLDADIYMIEDLPYNARSSGVTGMVQGVVRHLLLSNQKRYILVTPASLKKYATGKGNANKKLMAESLESFLSVKLADDNQVDAYWLRLMGLDYFGCISSPVPDSHRVALEKVNWQ